MRPSRIPLPAPLRSTPVTAPRRYYERSDSCAGGSSAPAEHEHRPDPAQVSLRPVPCRHDHSVSTHLTCPGVAFTRYPLAQSVPASLRLRFRQFDAGSSLTSGRIEFVILRTGHSPSIAPHLASRRRSYRWVRAGERMPGEDFHLSVMAPLQAHVACRPAAGVCDRARGAKHKRRCDRWAVCVCTSCSIARAKRGRDRPFVRPRSLRSFVLILFRSLRHTPSTPSFRAYTGRRCWGQCCGAGRAMPSLRMRNCSVERFIPRRAAAPFGPATTQLLRSSAATMCRRSASSSVSRLPARRRLRRAERTSRLGGRSAPQSARRAWAPRQDHGALDQVLQLADVARPVVAASAPPSSRTGSSRWSSSSAARTAARSAAPASGCPRAARAAAARGSGRR